MNAYYSFDSWDNELYHHGIPGMRWGIRRYQNKDGSLTELGKKKYGVYYNHNEPVSSKKLQRDFNRLNQKFANAVARRDSANTTGLILSGRAIKKRLTPEKVLANNDRLSKKMAKTAKKQTQANADIAHIQSLQWRILGKAAEQGLTVHSKNVLYAGKTGKAWVRDIMLSPIASAFINVARNDIVEVKSKRIKVG